MSDRDFRIMADDIQAELDDARDNQDWERIRELEAELRRLRNCLASLKNS